MSSALDRTDGAIETIDPSFGTALETYPLDSAARIDDRLNEARAAFEIWRFTPVERRCALVAGIGRVLRSQREQLARLMTREMGKPIGEARAEVAKCAAACDYFAEHGAAMLAPVPVASDAVESFVAFRPLGVVLAIMPWNFPLWQVLRFAAPALVAGNAALLKHAANVTGCALAIERAVHEAGAPAGLFAALKVRGAGVAAVIDDPRIAAITLTGGAAAGSSAAAIAARSLKKSVLELGGSDAFIVLAGADITRAAKAGAKSRFQNCGQSCIAAKRFIVEEPVYEAYLDALCAETRALRAGDPFDETTQIGPLARADLRATIERQIHETVAAGARLMLGGKRIDRPGFFFEPAIVAGVTPAMTMFREETFGPAAAVVRASDAGHAVELANDSNFGLGGNVWTRDVTAALELAERLESGSVFINGMTVSDPRLPFGGVKRSGYGRELSEFGIREFVNVQTVWVGPRT